METNSQRGAQENLGPQNNLNNTLTSRVGRVLAALTQMGDQIALQQPMRQDSSAFSSTLPSNIPVHAYFMYVSINSGLADNQAIISLVLIERLCRIANQNGLPIIINSLNIHRLILASVLVVSKFYNDLFFQNSYVAYVGGVHPQEINLLEKEFIRILGWSLWVDPTEYDFYLRGIMQHQNLTDQNQQQQYQHTQPTIQ
eukprot:403358137